MQVSSNHKYIVMAKDRERVERLVDASGGKAKIVEELPICDGFVVEAAPDFDGGLFKSTVPGVKVVPDRKLRWIEPVAVEPAPVRTMAAFQEEPKVGVVAKTLGMEQVWGQGYTGKGVGIAILDSGIVNHDDFAGRLAVFKDFTDHSRDDQPWDAAGHGTHVAGDAAGSGKSSNGEFRGPAYEATLLGLKVGDQWGPDMSAALSAVQWAVDHKAEYNIRLMNMSFGGPTEQNPLDDPFVVAMHKAADAGITTFVAAGNEGPSSRTIGSPGYAPRAVTVGAADDRHTATRDDDRLARFSSRGPTPDGQTKPDVVAPGVNVVGPDAESTNRYVSMSGTSMASPVALGVAATWLQANPDLTPEQIKDIIARTSDPLSQSGLGPNEQGHGLIDAAEGLQMALAMKRQAAPAASAALVPVPSPAAAVAASVQPS